MAQVRASGAVTGRDGYTVPIMSASSSPSPAHFGLTDELRETIQHNYRCWLSHRGVTARQGQKAMIADIARTLAGIEADESGQRLADSDAPHICVVEAGTGTGKTLAYMLAVLPIAQARGLKLLVGTATLALQEQLLFRDLPDLLAGTDLQFTAALAKGRGRYACPARMWDQVQEQQQLAMEWADVPPVRASSRDVYRKMLAALDQGDWDGSRESWESTLADEIWAGTTADHAGCSGSRCRHYHACPYFGARHKVQQADVVIANHDLVLTDLVLGEGTVLPEAEQAIYIFDEAHHLADKALNHLYAHASGQAGERNVDAAKKLLDKLAGEYSEHQMFADAVDHAEGLWESLLADLRQVRIMAEKLPGLADEKAWVQGARAPLHRFALGKVDAPLRDLATELAHRHVALERILQELMTDMRNLMERSSESSRLSDPADGYQGMLSVLAQCTGRISAACDLWQNYAMEQDAGARVQARWVTRSDAGRDADLEFHASPLEACNTLAEKLWDRCYGIVLTSATLTATGGFKRFAEQTGIPDTSCFIQVPASFDYTAAELIVPRMHASPKAAAAHTDEIIDLLPKIIDPEEGTLVIFTSRRQHDQVLERLPAPWFEQILSQVHMPREQIILAHRARIDQGQGSIIFGLMSFAEGVDLPGDYCRHVILAKLPFAAPNDPLEDAMAEWVKANGRDPFTEISLVDATLRLKQMCGRLLRSETDTGRITLLDTRLVTRHYGQEMVDALPPFRRSFGAEF